MGAVQFANYYFTELSAPVAPTDSTIQVADDMGIASLIVGGNWIYLTLVDANSWQNNLVPPQTSEIVKVTAISGTGPYTLSVVRGEDGTSPQSFNKCDIAAFLLNAKSLYDLVVGGGGGGATGATGAAGPAGATGATGGGGSVSITATSPVIVTPSPITGTGVISAINMVGDSGSGGTHGLVPAPGAGDAAAGKFLKADATWAVPAGGGSGGVLQSAPFTTSGTWNVPVGVSGAWVNMIGGGGGGATQVSATAGSGGGGAGELVQGLLFPVVSGGTVTVTVGAAGIGGASGQVTPQPGVAGGDSSVASGSTFYARGGLGAVTVTGGTGGGGGGGAGGGAGNPGQPGVVGASESPTASGGGGGAGGGAGAGVDGGIGASSSGYSGGLGGVHASSQVGSGGGAATPWGSGGAGGGGGAAGNDAAAGVYGAGGGGAGGTSGGTTLQAGNGMKGYVVIFWVS